MIYADNAATTKMSSAAINAMLSCFESNYGNPSSAHIMGRRASEIIRRARKDIAGVFGCKTNEIYFTSGGSEGDTQAIFSVAKLGLNSDKKHIISTKIEHHAVLHSLDTLRNRGFEITLVEPENNGIIDPNRIKEAIRRDTCLVTVMYANNEVGTIQPISEIGAVCREAGVLFHSDAVQAAGHIEINVNLDNIDMLTISAHKFGGPKGIGALYVKEGIELSRIIEGGSQERGKRPGTENVPAIASMAAALTESAANMDIRAKTLNSLRGSLINGLLKIPGAQLNGDITKRLPGNVNISFEGVDGASLVLLLSEKGICASTGSACTSASAEPSHVLAAMGKPAKSARGALRITLSHENTIYDVDEIIKAVTQSVEFLRSASKSASATT